MEAVDIHISDLENAMERDNIRWLPYGNQSEDIQSFQFIIPCGVLNQSLANSTSFEIQWYNDIVKMVIEQL